MPVPISPAYMSVHHMHALSMETRRVCWISWKWNYQIVVSDHIDDMGIKPMLITEKILTGFSFCFVLKSKQTTVKHLLAGREQTLFF